jgi:hypothetical protein
LAVSILIGSPKGGMQQLRSSSDRLFGRQPGRRTAISELLFFVPMPGGSFAGSRINPQRELKA